MVVAGFLLEAGSRLGPFFLLGLKWRTMRVPFACVGWEVVGGMWRKASVMVGCRDAMLTARSEGLAGRVPQADANMSRQRGAMERSIASAPKIFGFRRHQSAGLFDESSVLRYLRACASFWDRENIMDGFAH